MECILCKHGTRQGDLRLCLICERLIKRAHAIQQEMLRVEAEQQKSAEKTEVVFLVAQV